MLGVSFSAPLVRLSHAHPLALSIWRVGLSMLLVGTILVVCGDWRQWRTLDRRALAVALAAGVLLALHFWSWNASVGMTSIAASVVLVNLHPIVVAATSSLWLGERPSPRQWAGIAIALAGALVVASNDAGLGAAWSGSRALLGDALAVVGAITVALYYTSGRRLRQTLDLWPYVGLVYGACLVTLVALALAFGIPFVRQPRREIAIFLGLALGPMMLGHTGMNWALKHLPAFVVALTLLGEPVGATALGALIPAIGEMPTSRTVLGGALILLGALLTVTGRAEKARSRNE